MGKQPPADLQRRIQGEAAALLGEIVNKRMNRVTLTAIGGKRKGPDRAYGLHHQGAMIAKAVSSYKSTTDT